MLERINIICDKIIKVNTKNIINLKAMNYLFKGKKVVNDNFIELLPYPQENIII